MKSRVIKPFLSLVLVLSMVLIPMTHTYAETIASTTKAEISTTANAASDTVSSLDEVKKAADTKASLLTSIYGATSVQYALIDNGKIVLSGHAGVYSKDSSTPLTETKMYGIGSISKMFTTVAVMQLVEEGKVSLDDPVINYLPEFTMTDTRYRNITVRMLLNHSSGLMGSTLSNAMLFNDTDFSTYDNLFGILQDERLKADPGEYSVYCNDGFTLAEKLVEKVTGKSFTEYIGSKISKPLNLYNTKTPQDNFQRESLAKAYIAGIPYTLPTESLNMIGAGGMYSSAENLCDFATIFMDDSKSNVLSEDSRDAMKMPEYAKGFWAKEEDSTIAYGLGWDSVNTYPFGDYGIIALSKGGDSLLYHGNLTVLPEENMAIAVLSSGGSSAYNQVMAQEILLSALKQKGRITEIKPDKTFKNPTKVSVPDDIKADNEGIYGNYGGVYKVEISKDGILSLSNILLPEAGTQKYLYTGDGKFYYTDGSAYISFVKEKNNITYLYASGYANLPGIGQTATSGYQAQKLENNPISQDVKAAWEKRSGKNYFLVNEKYSSEYYAVGALSTQITLLSDIEGYCMNAQITGKNTAQTNIEIPAVYGRDLSDYSFYTKDGTEYLKAGNSICISEDSVKTLSAKTSFSIQLGTDGYAKWYKTGSNSVNKTIKVTLPENSSFTVYDDKGTCINYSYVTGKNTVTLPKNGYIVFAGKANATFKISYVK